ncbi:MAG: GWxTD domain-containing protein [bacterium]
MKRSIIFFTLFLIGSSVFTQSKFKAEFDYANFFIDDTTSRLEIYYSFSKAGMKAIDNNDKKIVSGILGFSIKDKATNNTYLDKSWNFSSVVDNSTEADAQNLTGLLSFYLSVGKYKCKLIGRDANDSSVHDSLSFDLEIVKRASNVFSISDIELATKILQNSSDKESMFYKNTLEVTPNPSLIFGQGLPVAYYYAEFYNIDKDIKSEKLKVEHILYDANRTEKYRKVKYTARNNSSIVEVGQINISRYPSGLYTLVLAVSDSLKNFVATSAKNIYLYNPSVPVVNKGNTASSDLLTSEVASMSLEELNTEFSQCKYIASEAEKDKWDKLTDVEAKRKFYFDFWLLRDSDQLTPNNEDKEEYFSRVQYASTNFSNSMIKEGWRTDRGRVYLSFGPPSEISRYPYESETVPYEIWSYHEIEGGVEFVFADFNGFNDLRLIHSSKRGELSDQNWFNRIQR